MPNFARSAKIGIASTKDVPTNIMSSPPASETQKPNNKVSFSLKHLRKNKLRIQLMISEIDIA